MNVSKITQGLVASIPQGDHPAPHSECVSVRLDLVQQAIDLIEWLEKGNAEWRSEAIRFRGLHRAQRAATEKGLAAERIRAQQLSEELCVADKLLEVRTDLLRSIPECPVHGDQCVPHALEWVQASIRAKQPDQTVQLDTEPIYRFQEGQWWMAELDKAAATGSNDFKRAVAVVHHLLRSVVKEAGEKK